MDFRQKAALFVATGCYTGKAPIAPGTFGTMAGLPLCLLSARFNWQFSLIFAMSFTIFAIWVAHHAEKIIGEKDPGAIVIDARYRDGPVGVRVIVPIGQRRA